jgi:hypothetical protein
MRDTTSRTFGDVDDEIIAHFSEAVLELWSDNSIQIVDGGYLYRIMQPRNCAEWGLVCCGRPGKDSWKAQGE